MAAISNVTTVTTLPILTLDLMPKYDFRCEACNLDMEIVLAVESQLPHCTLCGGTLKRLWSAVPIHFKGRGWGSKP
jgi:putative FmdB family regulatory protein